MSDSQLEPDTEDYIEEVEEMVLHSLIEPSSEESTKEHRIPSSLFIFPIAKRPFFPGMAATIVIEPGTYYEVLKTVAKTPHKMVGLLLTKNEEQDVYNVSLKEMHKIGVIARILKIMPLEQGGAQVILNMESRFRVKKHVKSKHIKAQIEVIEEKKKLTQELKAYAISIISIIKELLKLNPLFKEELQIFLGHSDFTEPGKLADFAVALTTASRAELQNVLDTVDLEKRIELALSLLKKELDLSKIQFNINQKIEATITKSQRDYFLREQLKTIKRELGMDKDEKTTDREKFEARMAERTIPPDVIKVIEEELEKLSALEFQSAEYAVARGYLDWLTVIPWGIYSEENHNLKKARQILEEDHYGLKDIKERIIEFIGVGTLSGGVRGSIICLSGPPGVGKTSIGRSIARALNRKFFRFSVGGMRDEAEVKGHRRTYIGAMPGKLIQALKTCQTMNPVIMIDEVDKIGSGQQGDPASALLEALDPEQNTQFLDHYLDVRCDLSNILFITTANVLDTIPEPLQDRMDILRLSGYIMDEKIEIAKRYLIPRNRKSMGIKANQIAFADTSLRALINGYAREAGVRSLEHNLKKIMRKVAVLIIDEASKRKKKNVEEIKQHRITTRNLKDFLGKPIFTSDRIYEQTPIGVCTGLAWTALGGAILYIEAIKIPGEKTALKLTGQAGDIMKESAQIAWSFVHSMMSRYAPGYTFFEKNEVHLHFPEGATPKDGPSAGISIVTALLSLLLNTPIKDNLAMTGEITLTGLILGIGGVKEKVVAARRSELKTLIFPKENERDVEQLSDYIKEGLEFHFVTHYDEIFPIAFSVKRSTFE